MLKMDTMEGTAKRMGAEDTMLRIIINPSNQSARMSHQRFSGPLSKSPSYHYRTIIYTKPLPYWGEPLSLHRPERYPIETPPSLCTTKQLRIYHGICTEKGVEGIKRQSASSFAPPC